jgi:hypothetical protein
MSDRTPSYYSDTKPYSLSVSQSCVALLVSELLETIETALRNPLLEPEIRIQLQQRREQLLTQSNYFIPF